MATIKHDRTRTEYTFTVEGAAPIKKRYGTVSIIPSLALVTFLNGEWQGTTIFGPREKKDGTAGETHHDEHFSDYNSDDLPDWAQPLTDFTHATKLAEG